MIRSLRLVGMRPPGTLHMFWACLHAEHRRSPAVQGWVSPWQPLQNMGHYMPSPASLKLLLSCAQQMAGGKRDAATGACHSVVDVLIWASADLQVHGALSGLIVGSPIPVAIVKCIHIA